ncbi:MAG: hypothetical protein HY681_12600 [Chloroflexi bacterium]|nr:hypothetical protein [Chloroflexota bacterium]
MLRLGWFSTGRGEGSRALLSFIQGHIASGALPACIEFVFCNREPGEVEGSDQFHALARSYGIPLVTLSSERFRKERKARRFDEVREQYDAQAIQLLSRFDPDAVVLAGYMLFTAAEMCSRYNLLNLHPAAPGGPAGAWQQIVWHLIERKATASGIQVQLATMDWDRGPLISYCTFPITGPTFDPLWRQIEGKPFEEVKATQWEEMPLFQRIRREGQRREAPLLLETLRAVAEDRIKVSGRQVLDREGRPIAGYCLNDQVEAWLKTHPDQDA